MEISINKPEKKERKLIVVILESLIIEVNSILVRVCRVQ